MSVAGTDGDEGRDGLDERVIARLAPGSTIARAQQEMSAIAARLRQDHPNDNPAFDVRVTDLHGDLVGDVRD